jgi:hypothetical protein
VHKPSIVTDHTVSPHKHIIGHRVSEDFDLQSVSDDLLSFLVEVGMDQCHIIVTSDDVPQGGELLLDPDYFDGFRETVPDVSEFVIGRVVWYQKSLLVS